MSKVFIDTNILVYSVDGNDPNKQAVARQNLQNCVAEKNGVISTQVLQEFYVTLVQKLNVDPLTAKDFLNGFARFEVIVVTPQIIMEAVDVSILNRLSFWDSLIIASAVSASCDLLLTEDLNHSQVIRGLSVVNPFVT